MGHLGILLTVLALASGVISLTFTINLYQKIRVKYLKIHKYEELEKSDDMQGKLCGEWIFYQHVHETP